MNTCHWSSFPTLPLNIIVGRRQVLRITFYAHKKKKYATTGTARVKVYKSPYVMTNSEEEKNGNWGGHYWYRTYDMMWY